MAPPIAAPTTSSSSWSDKGAKLDVKDKEGRTPLTWAEGVFLATHPAEPKPASIALIKTLIGAHGDPVDEHERAVRSSRLGRRRAALVAVAGRPPQAASRAAAAAPRRHAGRCRASSSEYCVTCHNERMKTGWARRSTRLGPRARRRARRAVWEKVVRKIKTGHDAAERRAASRRARRSTPSPRRSKRSSIAPPRRAAISRRRRCTG